MSRSRRVLAATLALAAALLAAPAAGTAMQCKEPREVPGSRNPTGDSRTDKCWCGLIIKTDILECPTKVRVVPDRILCDGPENEVRGCGNGAQRWILEEKQECTLVRFEVPIVLDGVKISLPICVATVCRVLDSIPIELVPSGREEPCGGYGP